MQALQSAPAPTPNDVCRATVTGILPPQVIITLTDLFGDDLQQWRFIVDLFSETLEQDLVNLGKAIRGGEDALIIEAAHRIVGSSRMLGHLPIGDAARAVERIAQSIGPYHERVCEMQSAMTQLRALADAFRLDASRCAWPESAVAG